jgi:hypothetical protein
MSASGGGAKQPFLTAYNKGLNGVLGEVVVNIDVAVLSLANQLSPILIEITQRYRAGLWARRCTRFCPTTPAAR